MASNAKEVNALMRAYDEGYEKARLDALNDLIEEVKIEIDEIYDWNDDYFIGMRAGYQYTLEIAERLKEHKT